MTAVVTIKCTIVSSTTDNFSYLRAVMCAVGNMMRYIGWINKSDWRECDLYRGDGVYRFLILARDATSAEDARQAESTIDSIMCEIRDEINRTGRATLSFTTTLSIEKD